MKDFVKNYNWENKNFLISKSQGGDLNVDADKDVIPITRGVS